MRSNVSESDRTSVCTSIQERPTAFRCFIAQKARKTLPHNLRSCLRLVFNIEQVTKYFLPSLSKNARIFKLQANQTRVQEQSPVVDSSLGFRGITKSQQNEYGFVTLEKIMEAFLQSHIDGGQSRWSYSVLAPQQKKWELSLSNHCDCILGLNLKNLMNFDFQPTFTKNGCNSSIICYKMR